MNAYYHAVKQIIENRKADKLNAYIFWQNALDRFPALREAYIEYQTEAIKNAQKLPNSLPQAKEKLKKAIESAKIPLDKIDPPPRCPRCNDSGYIDGKYCKCVINRVINSNKDNFILPQIDFEKAKQSAPKSIAKVYAAASEYFSSESKPFFVITGSSGTGKTVLAAAMATKLMECGQSAVSVTAFDFVKRAKDYHTQFAIEDYTDLFTPMLDSDVLVIDDLGTETILKNITREYLYTVINERWMRNKKLIVTTNLAPNALLARYGEAIFSRLCDKSKSYLFSLLAPNQRIK